MADPGPPWRLTAALAARQSELRHAVRVSVAVGAAFLLATLLRLPQGYWAVFTAVIVVQASVGATITASIERFAGTLVGAAAGAGAVYLREATHVPEGALLVGVVAILAFVAAVRPALKVAPVTAVIMLIGQSGAHYGPLITAVYRVSEISVGSLVGVAATLLIFPARAHAAVVMRVRRSLEAIVAVIDALEGALLTGAPPPLPLYDATRTALGALATAMAEASRESATHVSERSLPDAVARTLWRVRNDTSTLGRLLRQPVLPALQSPALEVLAGARAALALCAQRLEGGPAPDRLDLARRRADFETAITALRDSHADDALTVEAASRTFGLAFALDGLVANTLDLADRLDEARGEPSAPAAQP